jgi:hypothetical protein
VDRCIRDLRAYRALRARLRPKSERPSPVALARIMHTFSQKTLFDEHTEGAFPKTFPDAPVFSGRPRLAAVPIGRWRRPQSRARRRRWKSRHFRDLPLERARPVAPPRCRPGRVAGDRHPQGLEPCPSWYRARFPGSLFSSRKRALATGQRARLVRRETCHNQWICAARRKPTPAGVARYRSCRRRALLTLGAAPTRCLTLLPVQGRLSAR